MISQSDSLLHSKVTCVQAAKEHNSFQSARTHLPSTFPDAVSAAVEIDPDFRCVRRRLPYAGRDGFDIVTPFEASKDLAQGKLYASIIVPARSRSDFWLSKLSTRSFFHNTMS